MTTQIRLRRLAARTIRIIEKNQNIDAIAMISDYMKDSAARYLKSYDNVQNLQRAYTKEYAEGKSAIGNLRNTVVSYLPVLKLKYPHLVQDMESSGVPDDLMNEVNNFLDNLSDLNDRPAEVNDRIIPALENALKTATKEWTESDTSRTQLQSAQEELRNLAGTLSTDLVQFRRILAGTLGRTSYDYQSLRDNSSGKHMEGDPEEPATPVL